MSSHVLYYYAAVAVILTHSTIVSVNGQCTIEGCENGEPSTSIVGEIQQLSVDAFRQLNKQVQSIREIVSESFQEMKSQLDTVNISLQTVDKCPQEPDNHIKVQNTCEFLNESFQEMKSQHDAVMKSHNDTVMRSQHEAILRSLHSVDRRSQKHDIDSKQLQITLKLLNESFQEMKSQNDVILISQHAVDRRSQEHDKLLNESFQQMRSQHDAIMTSLQAVDRRLQEHDISIKNLSENLWKLANAVDRRLQEHDTSIKNQSQNVWKLANDIIDPESQVKDCSDIKASGQNASGVYEVCVKHQLNRICTYAFCDMEVDNGSSLVFQRRKDGSVNFNRTWTEYKQGFGFRNGEFWLGNEMLHLLTSKRNYKLRIDLEDFNGAKRYAEYTRFSINSSAEYYRLTVDGYSGTAGDSLNYHNGKQFSTIDVDNAVCGANCVRNYGGAWWHNCCSLSTLNGKYYHRNDIVSNNKGIHWYYWHNGMHISLKATTMKLVPVA